jgi:hypothetical protein
VTAAAASPYVLPGVSPSSVHVIVGNELAHPRRASPISWTAAASLRSIALRNRSRSAGDACRLAAVGAIDTQPSLVDRTCACSFRLHTERTDTQRRRRQLAAALNAIHHPITIAAQRTGCETYFSPGSDRLPELHRSERTLTECDALGAKMGDIDECAH